MGWTPDQLPDLSGKTYAITGGNSGLGLEAAAILSGKGARVVITSRKENKAVAALDEIRSRVPDADVDWVQLDLADLSSVEAAAAAIRDKCPQLDALINNAGVMQTPELRTQQGFELQIGTNHLGHFRLNALLFDHLEAQGARLVAVSSVAHKFGSIRVDDLNFESGRYDPSVSYCQSKLANLMYTLELQRRLDERGSSVASIGCHPGYAATNLQSAGVGLDGGSWFLRTFYKLTNAVVAQSAEQGAYPLVLAAAWPEAKAGGYYGPTWFGDSRGPVGESSVARKARDPGVGAKLWEISEGLVGTYFSS